MQTKTAFRIIIFSCDPIYSPPDPRLRCTRNSLKYRKTLNPLIILGAKRGHIFVPRNWDPSETLEKIQI